jgi:hypothetical protein
MNEVNKAYVSVQDLSDRSISFVHFIHVDVSDDVDKSWTEASTLFTALM